MQAFETLSLTMEPRLLVQVQAPPEDIDRIMASVTAITPLTMGKYDHNAFELTAAVEHYRPRPGAAAGAEEERRKRPGVSTVSFQIEDDQALLAKLVEAVFQVHSYQEPVITVQPILASRSKGLDDKANPHRWWNTVGDWKAKT